MIAGCIICGVCHLASAIFVPIVQELCDGFKQLELDVGPRIFLSHKSDAKALKDVEEALKSAGCEVRVAEEDPRPGKPLRLKIEDGIYGSEYVVVLWTEECKKSPDSSWIPYETGYAVGKERKLIPIVEKGVEAPNFLECLEYIEYDPDNLANSKEKIGTYFTKHKEQLRKPS